MVKQGLTGFDGHEEESFSQSAQTIAYPRRSIKNAELSEFVLHANVGASGFLNYFKIDVFSGTG